MLPSGSNGMKNFPPKLPFGNILFTCLLIILGRKILVIFAKSFISFLAKATSALFNKKSEVKNDLNDKNKSSLDKIISFFLTKIFGF